MKRVWKLSESAESKLMTFRTLITKPKNTVSQTPYLITTNPITTSTHRFSLKDSFHSHPNLNSIPFPNIIGLFSDRLSHNEMQAKEDLIHKASVLRNELIRVDDFRQDLIFRVLDEKGSSWFKCYDDGAAFVELLRQLEFSPRCAVEVLNWRRKQADNGFPMTAEEYAKGIRLAGRSKNIDLATELFTEAANRRIKTAATYNALLGAYMYNDCTDKCQLLYGDFKKDISCKPTVVTYNILISVFGRLMLIKHMEAALQEMKNSNIMPNRHTYNMLLGGYVTAWMWDTMEKTYKVMEASGIHPDIHTHLLLLRGYAHSGNLKKMEEIYKLVNYHVIEHKEFPLIRAMVCAYCKSKSSDRVQKVEELLKLIPKHEYKSWLNVMLIKLYAQEDIMDMMESYIDEAFAHNISVKTAGIMRCIITSYFRANASDKLTNFVKRAEYAEWKICRSLYHCRMVMYSSENRLAEMEGVLSEMGKFNLQPTKKTFLIMYKAYLTWGQKRKLDQILGVMCTQGFGIPSSA
ncbi:Pentatricopeptide repeat-containing protein [Heracleum sosnowskyi]|uniref:Pentatricopeptide repeat-containing protein n=1 Tax=Heracleum sosnowskyi TaxID=360622 RepID=A0AAD8GZT5_9APIA|nr:Pentatricopeptide repeat-containing protein [Heracleum sosnowskyi]